MQQRAYAAAGVDIDLGNQVKSALPRLLASTHRREVLGKVGGFGGLFALDVQKYREPVLVSSVDGVGTKLKIAFAMDRHDTIGQDLVNHCVNDIAVLGAEPLFFLDYLGSRQAGAAGLRGDHQRFRARLRGKSLRAHRRRDRADARFLPARRIRCERHDCRRRGKVEDDRRQEHRPGDAVIGLASSGLHTNGYSLARKIFFEQMKLRPDSVLEELGRPIGEALLDVHISYLQIVRKVLRKFNPVAPAPSSPRQRKVTKPAKTGRLAVKGLAHITGGGFVDNIPRILPKNCDAVIRKGAWEVPPIFCVMRQRGPIEERELYQVFNMGIGMAMIVAGERADAVLSFLKSQMEKVWIIGEVVLGTGATRIA